jgi:hypothetical protein
MLENVTKFGNNVTLPKRVSFTGGVKGQGNIRVDCIEFDAD